MSDTYVADGRRLARMRSAVEQTLLKADSPWESLFVRVMADEGKGVVMVSSREESVSALREIRDNDPEPGAREEASVFFDAIQKAHEKNPALVPVVFETTLVSDYDGVEIYFVDMAEVIERQQKEAVALDEIRVLVNCKGGAA